MRRYRSRVQVMASVKHEKATTKYWEDALQGFIGVCERQHPVLSCARITLEPDYPSTLSHTLPLQTSCDELKCFAERLGLRSTGTVLRTAFAYILSEYLELDRVILGEAIPSISSADSGSIVPVRVVLSLQDQAEELLRRVDDLVTGPNLMRVIPSETIRDILKCPPSQSPFNALFTHEDTCHVAIEPTLHHPQSGQTTPPISLTVGRTEQDTLSCTLSVRADLMDTAHLELVSQQIEALTTAIVAHPTEPVGALTALFPQPLLSIFTPSVSKQLENAPNLSPFHWVDHWATSNPNWPAVEVIESINEDTMDSRSWSYAELAQTSNRISSWLVRRGWRNSMIGEVLGDVVPPEGCEVVDINSDEFREKIESIEELAPVDALPSDNCYLLYTSGSTGLPKGVLVSRGNLSAFTEAQSEYICRDVPNTLTLGGTGSYLAHASRAFDVHLCEMVLGWRHGLRLVTAPRTMLLDNLRTVLTRCRISHAGFVPSLLEHTGVSAEQLPDLRYLGVGGEKISETIIERFVGKPSIALVNAYGPTEVTIGLTSHTVTTSSTVRNIGSAVGKITLHVLEPETNNYVKRAQVGELCVTGDLVAKGYHGRPGAKGFADFHGQHMYRTGDMVRLMANNCVEYLGRRDSQAKVRGQRLELEEVSIAVRRCANRPANVTSIVTPSPITKRPQLVTFISPASDRPEKISTQPEFVKEEYRDWVPQVLERCRQQLPAYMVPSVLLPLSFIPIQISGKADNRRLVALYESIPASDLLHEANGSALHGQGSGPDDTPLTADEQQVCDVVCAVTSADARDITKNTSIFKLGIDSLSSLGLVAQMRKIGYVCSAADILRNDTIVQLANLPRRTNGSMLRSVDSVFEAQVSEAMHQLEELDQTFRRLPKSIPNSSIAIIRPCLPLQESLVSNSMDNPTPLYVNHIMLRLGPSTSLEHLKSAFEDLIQENEIFRTCFQVMDDQVVQVVLKPRVVRMPWDEIESSDEEDARHQVVGGIETRPPLHFTAASSSDDDHPGWLMLMNILLDRLYLHCTGERSMSRIDLTPLYQHFMISTEKDAERHWSRYLAGYRPGIISTEDTSDVPYTIVTEKVTSTLSALSRLASKISTTTPLVLETIWAIALAKFLGHGDVMFGRVMNGRAIPVDSVETMLIPLVTTVPARLRIDTSSLVELIKRHTRASLECLPYQHTPLRAIQRYVRASGPLFNSMFSYVAMRPSPVEPLLQEIDSVMEVDYPLALEVRADAETDSVTLRLRAAGDPSVAQNAHAIISTMLILLQNLESSGDAPIDVGEFGQEQEQKPTTWDENCWAEGEAEIRSVLSEVTGVSELQISKNISFFALGIDSVISIRLARCLQEKGVKASSSEVLKYPSVGSLYDHLQKASIVAPISQVEKPPVYVNLNVELLHADDSIIEKLYQETEINMGSFASAARTVTNARDKSTQFWVDAVTDYEHAGLPVSLDPRVESQTKWAQVKVQTPVADLLRLCSSLEVTMQTVALLAYGRSLALLLGQRDVVFGHVVSGRALDDGTASIIGPLLNTVPFRLTLDPILRNTRSVLQYIQRFCADSLHHHHASLAEVQRAWRLSGKSANPALFDALFTFNRSESLDPASLFQPYVSDLEPAPPHYRLNVEFEQAPEFLLIRVSCRGILVGENELEAWLETLALGFVDIVSSPDAPVLSFPVLLRSLPLNASPQLVEDEDVTATGQQLAIIKEILATVTRTPVAEIRDSSSIFTLGVDSILAMDISAKCRDSHIKLSVSDILQGKTVQGIARLAAKRLAASSEPIKSSAPESIIDSETKARALEALSLAEGDVDAVLPCLSGQTFYISRWLQSGRRLWEFTFAFKSNVRLDVDQLQYAWHLLQQRHSVLRTSFAAISPNDVVQVVSKPHKASGEVHINKLVCAEHTHALRDLVQQIASMPSTLSKPPARLHLLQSRDSDVLLLTLHHALYDAFSLPILLQDLEALYLNTSLPFPIDFSSFISQAQREPNPHYWNAALRNAQPTILGSNTSTPQAFQSLKSSQAQFPHNLTAVETLCRQHGISLPALILLAIGRALARVTGATNPTFGLFQAGRSSDFPGLDEMAGPSVNVLPFVVQDALSALDIVAASIQRDLAERALHDQADLRRLMKAEGSEVVFNVLVNIVVGNSLRNGARGEDSEGVFTPLPFALDDDSGLGELPSVARKTSVDGLDCDELPCRSNVMLEVGYSEVDDALVWKVDYTEGLLSEQETGRFLGVVEEEVKGVLACL
ncbi:putative nonribosomal peptide synthase [Aspergillus steynii IBT 23096]|uniref:Putative nonribosomal peptide synthase n=1 Tax=Aspergillus steynii IBT 23096 TaxID=1392250 RepID=A0A2I2GJY6_9EURO|nr:putative nonribosomal peptide synthase [Aspergillus steynii IBT 23096]PLB53194.1 putative nonribosomal peptide synthase [Aspergillus steynii IBT 23096]